MKSKACYFCDSAVEEKRPLGGMTVVTCPNCGRYLLTDSVRKHLLERENHREFLDAEDKRKLSDYVKSKFDPNTDAPVKIDKAAIKKVTGWRDVWIW